MKCPVMLLSHSLLHGCQIARHIVGCLGPFRRPDCEQGRINTTKDFKRLARKVLTLMMFWSINHPLHFHLHSVHCH